MKILLKPNFDKPDAVARVIEVVEKLREIAQKRGQSIEILLDTSDKAYIGEREAVRFGEEANLLSQCDVVMPIGGDGTIMRAAKSAAQARKPILGLNAGHVGFLTQIESHELDELDRLILGNYTLFDRMMLEAVVDNDGKISRYIALNDVVIRHGDADRIVAIEVREGERLVAYHRADGVIFSTPTGSTAYSMSAGGAIVSPELSLILMTAICPHSAFNCSLVLPPEREYTVREKLLGGAGGMYVSLDGVRVEKLKLGGSVTVTKSATAAKFIDLGLREFFSNLNEKLSWRG